jgi:hypothetical protein
MFSARKAVWHEKPFWQLSGTKSRSGRVRRIVEDGLVHALREDAHED